MIKEPLIEFVDVTKSFDGRTILVRVNFKIFEGEVRSVSNLRFWEDWPAANPKLNLTRSSNSPGSISGR
jgi:hypothetical protein